MKGALTIVVILLIGFAAGFTLLALAPKKSRGDAAKIGPGNRFPDWVGEDPANKSRPKMFAQSPFGMDASAGPTFSSWAMHRGGAALLGVAPGSLPDELTLRWQFKTEGPVLSSAAVYAGRVYIGSNDGQLYALNLKDGSRCWTFKTEDAVESSPCVLGGKVFFGSADTHLYAVDAESGALRWKYKTGDKILGAPNWSLAPEDRKPRILVGSYDNHLHCVDAESGKAVWTYQTENFINGAPAIAEGKAVFGGCDGILHVVSLADGKMLRELKIGAYIASSASLLGGRAFFGHYENRFLSVDITQGEVTWSYGQNNFPYFSSPAVTEDRVVFGGRDKRLHCVQRASGKPVWTFATRGHVNSSPVICGNKVVAGSDDGRLYIVSLDQGKEVWSYEIGRAVSGSPAVAGGLVIVGSEDGCVYAFGMKP